jgi:hypothetical protein
MPRNPYVPVYPSDREVASNHFAPNPLAYTPTYPSSLGIEINASTYTPPTRFLRLPEDDRHPSPRASIDRRTDAINYHYVPEGSDTPLPEIASLHDPSRGSYRAREETDYEDCVRAAPDSVWYASGAGGGKAVRKLRGRGGCIAKGDQGLWKKNVG